MNCGSITESRRTCPTPGGDTFTGVFLPHLIEEADGCYTVSLAYFTAILTRNTYAAHVLTMAGHRLDRCRRLPSTEAIGER